jgi:hypothetical protein
MGRIIRDSSNMKRSILAEKSAPLEATGSLELGRF